MTVDIFNIMNKSNGNQPISNSGTNIFNDTIKTTSPSDIDGQDINREQRQRYVLNRQVEIGLGTRLEHSIDDERKMDYMKSLSNEDKQLMYHFRDEGYGFRASKALLENRDKLADPMQYGTAKYKDYERNEKFYTEGGYDQRRNEDFGRNNYTILGDNADLYKDWIAQNKDNWNILERAGANVIGGLGIGAGALAEGVAGLVDKGISGLRSLWDKAVYGVDTDASFYRHDDRRVDEDILKGVQGAAQAGLEAAGIVFAPGTLAGFELFNETGLGERTNEKIQKGINLVVTNTPGLRTYYNSLDDKGKEDLENAIAIGGTAAVMRGSHKGAKWGKENTKPGRWVAEQEKYFNQIKDVTKEAFKYAKEGAKEQIKQEVENRKTATDLYDETGKKIGKAGEYGETKGAVGRVVDRAVTDFKDFWRFGKDFVDTFEPNNHNLRTVGYGAYEQSQPRNKGQGATPETQGEQEQKSESSSFKDQIKDKVKDKAEYVGDVVEGVFTGLSPEEKMRIKYSPYVKEKFQKLMDMVEQDGAPMEDKILLGGLYEELGDKIIDVFDKVESQLDDSIPAYQQLRKDPRTYDFSSSPKIVEDVLGKRNITVNEDGRLIFTESPFADAGEMTILQRAYDIVKRLSLEEQNANDFLNKKSQLKTFLNKYQNQQDKTVFKLLSQINHAIFVEEGHKLIPHLAEIDAIRSKNLNNINDLKKGRVYKQGDEKGQLRNNFYSIVKNLTGENRKKMLQRMEEFYPGIAEEIEAIELAGKLLKRYKQAPEMAKNVGFGGVTGGYAGAGGGIVGVMIGAIIGAVAENMVVKPITRKIRRIMIDRLMQKLSPRAEERIKEIAEKQRYASELSKADREQLERITQLIKDEMEGGMLDPEKIQKEETKKVENEQKEKRKEAVKKKKENPEEYEREKEDKKQKRIAKRKEKKENKEQVQEQPKALEYFSDVETPQTSVLSLVEPKALENKSPKALVFKELPKVEKTETKKEEKSETPKKKTAKKEKTLDGRFSKLTVEEYRKMKEMEGIESDLKHYGEKSFTQIRIANTVKDIIKELEYNIDEIETTDNANLDSIFEDSEIFTIENLKEFEKLLEIDKRHDQKTLTEEDKNFLKELGIEEIPEDDYHRNQTLTRNAGLTSQIYEEFDHDVDFNRIKKDIEYNEKHDNLPKIYKEFKALNKKYGDRWDINSYYKKTPEEIREEKIQDMKEIEEHYNEDKFQPLREYVTDEELQNLMMGYQDHSMNELNSDEKFMREEVDRVLSGIEMTNKRIEKIKQEEQTPENQEKIKRLTEQNKGRLEELKPYLIQEKYVKLAKNGGLNDIDLKELEYLKGNTTIETVLNTNNNDGVQGVKTETNEGVLGTDQGLSTRETTVGSSMNDSGGLRGYDNGTQGSSVSSVTESGIGSGIPTKSQQRLNNQTSKKILEDHNFSKNPADYTAEELNILKNYEGAGGLTKKGEDLTGVEDQFYTPQKVVNKTWALADKYIDKEGPLEVLEPTVGTGRFIRDGDHFTGYEIDKYPGTIAQILNPQASIVIGDFQNQFMDFTGTKPAPYIGKKYDVVIGNPPYKERHTVQRTNGDDKKISRFEEYFIKKGIDVLNDGGVLAMVVPSSWLRNGGSRGKDEILKSATLVDAYRLPAGVFNNTEVNTDIIVLKKDDSGSNKLSNDERFKEHPEKILGVEKERRGRFGMEKYVEGKIENLDRIDATPKKLNTGGVEKQRAGTPKNDYTNTVNEIITSNGGLDSNDSMILTPTDPNLPTLQIEKLEGNKIEVAKIEEIDGENVATDGIIGTVENGKIIPEEKITLDGTTEKVKDTTLKDQKLEDYKAKTEQEIADNYKPKEITKDVVNTPKPKKTTEKKTTTKKATSLENQTVIKGDPNLETHDLYFGGEGTTEKQYEYRMKTGRDRTIPGVKVSDDPEHLNYFQGETMMNELYFAGDIYLRLEQLERDKEYMTTEQYNKQKAGLEKVLPTPYTAKDISFTPVDPMIMDVKTDQIIRYGRDGEEPEYYTVGDLFKSYLNKLPYNGVLQRDQALAWIYGGNMKKETKAQTIELTKKEFNHFVKTQLDKDVLNKWVDNYNRRYRSYVKPDFKNLPLVVQGISKTFRGKPLSLTEGQLQGINFLDLRRGGIVAHGVGHGKTMEGVVTVEKAIQTGKAKRPLLIVPKNTMVDNWISTYTNLYPNREIVNLGTLSVKDITRLRKEFGNNPENWIKDGQVAIISKEGFRDKLTLSGSNTQKIISKLKDNFSSDADSVKARKNKNERIEAEFGTGKKVNKTAREFYLQGKKRPGDPDNNLILKDLFDLASDVSYEKFKEKAKERFSEGDRNRGGEEFKYNEEIEKDIEAIRDMSTTKLEDLGIDYLCVDEAHNFKNIFKNAKLDEEKGGNNRYGAVKGISGGSSAMGRALYLASQYINETYGGNVSLLTATPFNNQALEVYNMLSLIGKDALEEMGLENINDFYNKFASFQNEIVADSKGGFESKLIMKSFDNATELQRLVNTFIDYLGDYEKLVKPQKITKKIILQMSEKQQEIQQQANMLINSKSNKGDVLKGIGMARRNLISPYLVTKEIATPKEFVETSPKIKASIEIIKSFKDTGKKDGIFVYFPDGVAYHETYKKAIVEYTGIPAEKIGIINGSTKDPDAVAEQYRKGEIQVLIGGESTTEGIDLQSNGYITMNMQLGWNPTDVTQLNGRQWRQGNLSNEVLELIFLYENSVDMKQMQLYEEKAGRIGTIFETQGKVFDTGTINPEEEKLALCTDPAVKTKLYMDMQIERIKYEKSNAQRDYEIVRTLENDLKRDKDYIERLEKDKTLYETRYTETQNEYYKDTLKQVEKDLKKTTKSYEKNLAKAEQFGDLTKAKEELQEKINSYEEELKTLEDKEPEILSQFVKESEEQAKQRKTITDYVEDLKVDFDRQTRFTSRDELENYLKEKKKEKGE